MSLLFRNGTVADLPAVASLVSHSFPGVGATVAEWERLLADSPHGGVEALWVGDDDGRIVAACRLLRFRQWVGGRTIPIMGLSTVAISATDRRRGLAAELTASGLRESRRRGDVASALYPFRDSFYRKLGYGLAGEVRQYLVSPRSLPDSPDRSRVTLVVLPDARADLARVYDRWAPNQTGHLVRPERSWERIWEGGNKHCALYRDESGDPRGYLVFRYVLDSALEKRALDIEEAVWLDRRARLGLYGWLSSLSDQWGRIVYRAHPDEAFSEHLEDHRTHLEVTSRWHHWFPESTVLLGPMFRILDVERAWSDRRVNPGDIRLALEVHDEQVPENNARWMLALRDGGVQVKSHDGVADFELRLDIETLSRIYIGALSPSSAILAGLATMSGSGGRDLKELDAILALPKPWMYDRF